MTPKAESTALAIASPTASTHNMENTLSVDVLALIATAVKRREHGCETDLTPLAAENLAINLDLRVWCSRSRDGKSHSLRSLSNTEDTHVAARSYDLAFGPRDSVEPTTLVQLKYDKGKRRQGAGHKNENCGNQPFQHAIRDLIFMSPDFLRLGGVKCLMISVVHKDNLVKEHRWQPFLREAEWTFVCEPSAVGHAKKKPRDGFLDKRNRLLQPYTLGQANQVFGTPWQCLGYGLFAWPGVLTVRFRTRSTMVEDFAVIEWRLLEVLLTGASAGVSLAAWLP